MEMLELWVSKAMANGVLITGETLRQKWRSFADLAGVPDDKRLTLSEGWLSCFKNRTNLKQWKRHGKAGAAEPAVVEQERQRVQEIIKKRYGYQLKDIFNMDKMDFSTRMCHFLSFEFIHLYQ
jgi:hypothetical protein